MKIGNRHTSNGDGPGGLNFHLSFEEIFRRHFHFDRKGITKTASRFGFLVSGPNPANLVLCPANRKMAVNYVSK